MITRRKLLQASTATAACIASGAWPANAANAPGVTNSEIKIGQTMPYSGPASAYAAIGKSEAAAALQVVPVAELAVLLVNGAPFDCGCGCAASAQTGPAGAGTTLRITAGAARPGASRGRRRSGPRIFRQFDERGDILGDHIHHPVLRIGGGREVDRSTVVAWYLHGLVSRPA